MKLSVDWIKTGLVIPIDEPKEKDYVVCAYDYGSENGFTLDRDAPIVTSNDGEKAAIAYVVNGTTATSDDPSISGAEIRSDYTNDSGEKAVGIVRLILYYFPSDQFLEVEIFAGPDGEKLAFSPGALGLDAKQVAEQLGEHGVESIEFGDIGQFVEFDDFTFRALGDNMGGLFIRIAANNEINLKFENISNIPTENTNILLFPPNNSLIAVKRLSIATLSSDR